MHHGTNNVYTTTALESTAQAEICLWQTSANKCISQLKEANAKSALQDVQCRQDAAKSHGIGPYQHTTTASKSTAHPLPSSTLSVPIQIQMLGAVTGQQVCVK